MKRLSELRLRTSVSLLLVGTILVTLAIVGSGILAVMVARINQENQAEVTAAAADMAGRVEVFLAGLKARVELAGELYRGLPPSDLPQMLGLARQPTLDAIYVIDPEGKLVAASIAGASQARLRELQGIDLSAYPFFTRAIASNDALWSDKHISAVTGKVTLGLAAPIGARAGVIIAELPLATLLKITRIARDNGGLDFWIVDSKGEVVADTNLGESERINLYNLPIVQAGFAGQPLPDMMTFGGTGYHVSASYSQSLGWLFVSRIPAGLKNPHLREIVSIVLVAFFGSIAVGLLLAPLWAQGIVRPLRVVAERAHDIAGGARPTAWPRGGITELNQLSADLAMMSDAITRREEELRRLNEELEDRVARRTVDLSRSNRDLSAALTTLEQAKDELIQAEKLAALGRLVAGVAHELNTPLGNGRMAITTLAEKLGRFERGVADGLRRSELDGFIQSVRTSTEIAERNLMRASALVGSFKQVAADRTASRRRKFQLREVVDEVLMTLSPSMRRLPIELRVDLPKDLWLDSYPGELGQALTNLIENCISHAFEGRARGSIAITAAPAEPGWIVLRLRDDGVGMAAEVAHRAFDPFFTTTLGRGGTGLGLFITHNAVANVLGGSITLDSRAGEGSCFELAIPLIAPPPGEALAGRPAAAGDA